MATLIFDIETVGEEFEKMDEITKKEITKGVDALQYENEEAHEKAREDAISKLALSPLTGHVVSIGIFDLEREKGCVTYRHKDDRKTDLPEEDNFKFNCIEGGEKELLSWFWKVAENYDTFVTFNGRGFDVPFLVARSAVHLIKPTKNLMKFRYLSQQRSYQKESVHVDLLEEFRYYGSVQKAGSLHFWCRALGIESPKREGENGGEVERMYNDDQMELVARYNVRDVISTAEVYKRWREYMDCSM